INEYPELLENGKYSYQIVINSLDEESFKEYVEKVGANIEDLLQTDTLSGIIINENYFQDVDAQKYVSTEAIKPIDLLNLDIEDYETDSKIPLTSIKIAHMTKEFPMGVRVESFPGTVNMIVSEQTFNELVKMSNEHNSNNFENP